MATQRQMHHCCSRWDADSDTAQHTHSSSSSSSSSSRLAMSARQEISRLMAKLEELWEGYTLPCPDCGGVAGDPSQNWLPVDQIEALLIEELGYEDQPEFEDALRGTFLDFLDNLLHATTKQEGGRHYFQLKADPPLSAWRAVKMTVPIKDTSDLWRVCFKSKWARIEIPELEFEISADRKRHTDSIYNHIASAVDTLSTFVKGGSAGLSEEHQTLIMQTVDALTDSLVVPRPFTWIVHDPSGTSEFLPMQGVAVEWAGEAGA